MIHLKIQCSVILSLMVLGGITLLCYLGFWQLSRADYKRTLQIQQQMAKEHTVLSSKELLNKRSATASLRYLPVAFQAVLDNEHAFLLDNQVSKGQVGYHVIVPAKLNEHIYLLINRGFIPQGRSRQHLPTFQHIDGKILIEGYLDFAYRNPFISQILETNEIQWPLRIQQLDDDYLKPLLGKDIYPMLVVLDEKSPYVFEPIQPKSTTMTPERHQGYAIQWFGLAITLASFYFTFLWLHRKKIHALNTAS